MRIRTLLLPITSLKFPKETGRERKHKLDCCQGKARIVCYIGRRSEAIRYNRSGLANSRVDTGDGKQDAVGFWL